MKEIRLAETAGFCFGVNRAVDLVYSLVENGEKVSTLGPIIHNNQVVSDLNSKGVRVISSPCECEKDIKSLSARMELKKCYRRYRKQRYSLC